MASAAVGGVYHNRQCQCDVPPERSTGPAADSCSPIELQWATAGGSAGPGRTATTVTAVTPINGSGVGDSGWSSRAAKRKSMWSLFAHRFLRKHHPAKKLHSPWDAVTCRGRNTCNGFAFFVNQNKSNLNQNTCQFVLHQLEQPAQVSSLPVLHYSV